MVATLPVSLMLTVPFHVEMALLLTIPLKVTLILLSNGSLEP